MPVSPSSCYIYKKEEIIPSLCKLMIQNLHTERWVFKIDDEHNGRGIAYFDVNSVSELTEQKKNVSNMFEDSVFQELQIILKDGSECTLESNFRLCFAYVPIIKIVDKQLKPNIITNFSIIFINLNF